jgi:hypothetical protein
MHARSTAVTSRNELRRRLGRPLQVWWSNAMLEPATEPAIRRTGVPDAITYRRTGVPDADHI